MLGGQAPAIFVLGRTIRDCTVQADAVPSSPNVRSYVVECRHGLSGETVAVTGLGPVLNEAVRRWLKDVTAGRYDDVRIDPESLEVQAHETQGEWRPAALLSHGTAEQIYLLLRVALAGEIARPDPDDPGPREPAGGGARDQAVEGGQALLPVAAGHLLDPLMPG